MEFVFESDQIPTDLVPVAAILGVSDESRDRVQPNLCEKRSVFDGLEYLDLLSRTQAAKLAGVGDQLARLGLQGFQAARVDRLLCTVESSQCAIDEIKAPGLAGSGRLVSGNDLGGYALHFRGLFRREKFKLTCFAGSDDLPGVLLSGQDSGPL